MLKRLVWKLFKVRCGIRGIVIGTGGTFQGRLPKLHKSGGCFELGNRLEFKGTHTPARLVALPGGKITIGDGTFINNDVAVSSRAHVYIGSNCKIGESCTIHDSDFHQIDEGSEVNVAPVHIGNNVWLAKNVTVAAGVSIGDHSVVGTGAVVTRDIPSRTLAAGVPAKAIRQIYATDGFVRK